MVEEFHKMMRYMGAGIVNLIYTYNPSCIVIGDEISSIGQPVLDELNKQLRAMSVTRLASHVKIELATLSFDSAYVGAAVVATRYIFDHLSAIFP